MKFVFEFLSLNETFYRNRADLAFAEYKRTQAECQRTQADLRRQELQCQREADRVNNVVAASAYFQQALKQPNGSTVMALKPPPNQSGPQSSKESENHIYKSNCMFPLFSHMSRYSHQVPGVVDFIRGLPPSAKGGYALEQRSLVSPS